MNWLRKLLGLKLYDPWEYGTCNGTRARRHRRNKNVQMILWKAGQQGHKEDCWYNFDSSWWPLFTLDNEYPWITWNPINPPESFCDLEIMVFGEGGRIIDGQFLKVYFEFTDKDRNRVQNVYVWRYKNKK